MAISQFRPLKPACIVSDALLCSNWAGFADVISGFGYRRAAVANLLMGFAALNHRLSSCAKKRKG